MGSERRENREMYQTIMKRINDERKLLLPELYHLGNLKGFSKKTINDWIDDLEEVNLCKKDGKIVYAGGIEKDD